MTLHLHPFTSALYVPNSIYIECLCCYGHTWICHEIVANCIHSKCISWLYAPYWSSWSPYPFVARVFDWLPRLNWNYVLEPTGSRETIIPFVSVLFRRLKAHRDLRGLIWNFNVTFAILVAKANNFLGCQSDSVLCMHWIVDREPNRCMLAMEKYFKIFY